MRIYERRTQAGILCYILCLDRSALQIALCAAQYVTCCYSWIVIYYSSSLRLVGRVLAAARANPAHIGVCQIQRVLDVTLHHVYAYILQSIQYPLYLLYSKMYSSCSSYSNVINISSNSIFLHKWLCWLSYSNVMCFVFKLEVCRKLGELSSVCRATGSGT